jgi:hypothetical protein
VVLIFPKVESRPVILIANSDPVPSQGSTQVIAHHQQLIGAVSPDADAPGCLD